MRRPLATCVLALAGAALPSSALAAPPTEADFEVRYWLTDEDGNEIRQLTLQDMQQLVNKARCECGQQIVARIQLTNTAGSVDPLQMQTFIGSQCAEAQQFPGLGTNLRCALLTTGFPDSFATRQSFKFHPLWLRTGVALGGAQDIEVAVAGNSCDSGQGAGGVWMCAEDGMQTDCQANEFFMQGTANANIPEDQTAAGIAFDFVAPVAPPTSFKATPGDEAVVIKWSLDTPGDINGFRILCADADGNPLPGKGVNNPSVTNENNGTIYYTAGNMCPDEPFSTVEIADTPGGGTTGGGTTGGGTSGGTSGSGSSSTGGTTGGGSSDTGTGGSDTGTAGTTTSTGTGTGTGTSTGGSAGTGTSGGGFPSEGIESLDYAYVCSGHLPASTNQARIKGLENGNSYQFLVVAYDLFGNPVVASDLLTAEPEATNDLWDTCQEEEFAGVCGDRGFCNCSVSGNVTRDVALSFLGLGLLGLVRRRRRA